jgi:hypothetical protein
VQQTSPKPKWIEFKPRRTNTLLGFAVIEFPSKTIIGEAPVCRGGDKVLATPPAKPKIDREGRVLRKPNGKPDYVKLIWFSDKEAQKRWQAAVVDAVREAYPEASADDGGAP